MLLSCCLELVGTLRNPSQSIEKISIVLRRANSTNSSKERSQNCEKPLFYRQAVAIPAGLEPATRGVEIRYSIQLSYGTVWCGQGPGSHLAVTAARAASGPCPRSAFQGRLFRPTLSRDLHNIAKVKNLLLHCSCTKPVEPVFRRARLRRAGDHARSPADASRSFI